MRRITVLHKEKIERKSQRKFLLWLLVVLVFLGVILYFAIELARIRGIYVSGYEHYTREEIIQMVGIEKGASVLDIYFNKDKDYSAYTYIESIQIDYKGLTTIAIQVKEKEVVQYIGYQDAYLTLDQSGYVIDYSTSMNLEKPLVEGLYIPSATIGNQLDVSERTLRTLLDLHHLQHKYQVPINRISFQKNDVTQVSIYVGAVTVIFGEDVGLDRKMKRTKAILKELSTHSSGTIDLRKDTDLVIFKKNSE